MVVLNTEIDVQTLTQVYTWWGLNPIASEAVFESYVSFSQCVFFGAESATFFTAANAETT